MENNLNLFIEKFQMERANVIERRLLWQTGIKKRLKDLLNKYAVTFNNIGFYAAGHNNQENHESVYLAISNIPSGIKDNDGKVLMLMGGTIHFSQIHNGKIRIWIEYPYIPDIASHNPDYEVFEDIEPNDLDESRIEGCVALFMQKQIEPLQERRLIGFH